MYFDNHDEIIKIKETTKRVMALCKMLRDSFEKRSVNDFDGVD